MSNEIAEAKGRVREYGRRYLSGTPDAFDAVRDLLDFLLRITIMRPSVCLRWSSMQGQPSNLRLLGVPKRGLHLKDGRYLDLTLRLQLDTNPKEDPPVKLRIYKARFQYQNDEAGKDWIFRYDYIRYPDDRHPASHLNLRGNLTAEGVPLLKAVHFPTGRISLEGIIRCIVEEFGCGTYEEATYWRPVLAESEREFNRIAHKTISGPDN